MSEIGPAGTEIGVVAALFRYPVKSMGGEALTSVELGFHGLEGDRRFAFLREGDTGGFPWLSASRLPSLVAYRPCAEDAGGGGVSHVRTPEGELLELRGEPLRRRLCAALGSDVRLMQLDRGIFDDAPVSLISTASIEAISRSAGVPVDPRRFRPNILVQTPPGAEFPENAWVGRLVSFGGASASPAVGVVTRDIRCVMVNLDPDSGEPTSEVLKAVVRSNENCAGVYATIFRSGRLAVGDRVFLHDV